MKYQFSLKNQHCSSIGCKFPQICSLWCKLSRLKIQGVNYDSIISLECTNIKNIYPNPKYIKEWIRSSLFIFVVKNAPFRCFSTFSFRTPPCEKAASSILLLPLVLQFLFVFHLSFSDPILSVFCSSQHFLFSTFPFPYPLCLCSSQYFLFSTFPFRTFLCQKAASSLLLLHLVLQFLSLSFIFLSPTLSVFPLALCLSLSLLYLSLPYLFFRPFVSHRSTLFLLPQISDRHHISLTLLMISASQSQSAASR